MNQGKYLPGQQIWKHVHRHLDGIESILKIGYSFVHYILTTVYIWQDLVDIVLSLEHRIVVNFM